MAALSFAAKRYKDIARVVIKNPRLFFSSTYFFSLILHPFPLVGMAQY